MMDVLVFSEYMQEYMQDLAYGMAGVYVFDLFNMVVLQGFFNIFGIHPRKLIGLPGILLSPFLHANTEHFVMNAIPFFFISLMMIAILDWDFLFLCLGAITISSGLLTWIVGRRGIHIGASGLVTGMFGWVLYWTIYHPNLVNIVILSLLVLYFGSIFLGIVPTHSKISWEGHLMGLIAGILCAKYPQALIMYGHIQRIFVQIYGAISM